MTTAQADGKSASVPAEGIASEIDAAEAVPALDYAVQAELFSTRNRRSKREMPTYRRFDNAAEAVRYAIEDLAPELLLGTSLQVDEERFDGAAIRALYDSAEFPLPRRAPAGTASTTPVAAPAL